MKSLRLVAAVLMMAVLSSPSFAEGQKRLCGTVVDEKGRPMEAAEVYWNRQLYQSFVVRRGHVALRALTDEDGEFTLGPVPEGEKLLSDRLLVDKPGYALTGAFVDREKIERSETLKLVLSKPASVSGRVVDEDGRGIEDALVYPRYGFRNANGDFGYVDLCPGLEKWAARTDRNGQFTMERLPEKVDQWYVTIHHKDYATLAESRKDYSSEPLLYEMVPPGSIDGQALDQQSGQPVSGVSINGVGKERLEKGYSYGSGSAVTDKNGRFQLYALPGMEYTLSQVGSDPKDATAGALFSSKVQLKDGEDLKGVQLLWTSGMLVEGRVVDAKTEQGIPTASVSFQPLQEDEHAQWGFSAHCDKDGCFSVRIPQEKAKCSAWASDYQVPEGEHGIAEVDPESSGEVVITLEPTPTAKITGSVIDPDGQPAANAVVALRFIGRKEVRADANGQFGFDFSLGNRPNLQGDEHPFVYAIAPERNLFGVTQLEGGLAGEHEIVIELEPAGSLTGRLVDEKEKPIEGGEIAASLHISLGGGMFTYFGIGGPVSSDATGRFQVNCLGDGVQYHLKCSAKEHGIYEKREIFAKAGETIDLGDITLPTVDKYLDVLLIEPDGKPVPDAEITYWGDGQPESWQHLPTDAQGKLRIENLVEGKLFLSPRKEGYNRMTTYTELGARKEHSVTIEVSRTGMSASTLTPDAQAKELADVTWLVGEGSVAQAKGKPLALLFFSCNNRPSRVALEKLTALSKNNGADKLAAMAVHDSSSSPAEIKDFLADKDVPFPVCSVVDDKNQGLYSPAFRAYDVRSIPRIVLIDREGKVARPDVFIQELGKTIREALDK